MVRLKLLTKPRDAVLNQIISIYREQGWWTRSDSKKRLRKFIAGSSFFLAAFYGNKVVGMGRVISDSVNDAYIQDLAVLKAFRNRNIGLKILSFLIKKLKRKNFKWIGLIAQNGTLSFYEKAGFKKMKRYHPMTYGF